MKSDHDPDTDIFDCYCETCVRYQKEYIKQTIYELPFNIILGLIILIFLVYLIPVFFFYDINLIRKKDYIKLQGKNMRTVLSLFDYSGNWCRPYRESGNYRVIQIDIKLGRDILTWDYTVEKSVDIMLIALPCDNYALSGRKWFKGKDKDGRTAASQKLVAKVKEIIDYFNPEIWVIENPMSRIHKLNPWMEDVKFKFNPYDFGDGYQKMTWLWGKFNIPVKNSVENHGNWMHTKLGGKSERTKELRSTTPMGFAHAFFEANK